MSLRAVSVQCHGAFFFPKSTPIRGRDKSVEACSETLATPWALETPGAMDDSAPAALAEGHLNLPRNLLVKIDQAVPRSGGDLSILLGFSREKPTVSVGTRLLASGSARLRVRSAHRGRDL